jgi:hypothetical protein
MLKLKFSIIEDYKSCVKQNDPGSLCPSGSDKWISRWWCTIDLDTAPLRISAVVERKAPATFMLRRTNPSTQKVPRLLGCGRVSEASARMKCLAARNELYVSDLTIV